MYTITKLTKPSQDFVTQLINSGSSRQRLVSFSIAKAIADSLPMTAEAQNDPRQTFRLTLEIGVTTILSKLNELVIVDTAAIIEYVRNLYIWRYRVAFDPMMVIVTDSSKAVAEFFSVSSHIDQTTLDDLANNSNLAMSTYNKMRALYKELAGD